MSAVNEVVRVIVAAALAAMLMSLGERTSYDERGLRIAAHLSLPQSGRG